MSGGNNQDVVAAPLCFRCARRTIEVGGDVGVYDNGANYPCD